MQFLEHHRKQFLALHAELREVDYFPLSDAGLTNLKTLLLLEASLLMGLDVEWDPPTSHWEAPPRPMAPPPRWRRRKAATPPLPPSPAPPTPTTIAHF